jgi:site-specific DNA recombinase
MKKRVAIYCRVSSDDQKERETIENQVDILRTYVEMKEDLEIYNEYLDDGVSGTIAFEDRKGGSLTLNDAQNGLFDIVLVYKVDRFGRDTLSGLQAVEKIRKYNVEIVSLTEPFDLNTPVGRYQFINYLNMAELERNNILDRMFLGATRAAKQGRWLGGIVPYGYYVDKKHFLQINEYEANVVRKIYDMYVNDRMTVLDITVYLNSVNIPCNYAARGTGKRNAGEKKSLWSPTTVQRILTSTTYMGIHEYGKRSTKRKETIVREVPQIIPIEIFEQTKQIKKENTRILKKNSPNREFLLRTLLKCADCGKTYYGIFYRKSPSVYSCSGKNHLNKKLYNIKCNNVNLNAEDIEEHIWGMCKKILMNFDEYTIDSSSNDERTSIGNELRALNEKINTFEDEKSNILKLYRKKIIGDKEVEEQLEDIKKEHDKVRNLVLITKNKLNSLDDKDSIITEFKSKFDFYKEKIENLSTEEKMQVIRMLIRQITVIPKIEDCKKIGVLHIDFNLSDLIFART